MKLIKSTITALGLLFTVTACAGNKESKNQNMKGENMENTEPIIERLEEGKIRPSLVKARTKKDIESA